MGVAPLSDALARVALCGAFLMALAAMGLAVAAAVKDECRKGTRVGRCVFALALVGAVLYGGAKSGRPSVTYPATESGVAYLADNGSYVTNDYVHIDFTRRIVPDDATLVVERREVASTNAADFAVFVETTFASFAVPTNLPCADATNWNWAIWADWTPPPVVQTNGVFHAAWGEAANDADLRAQGLAVGIPVRTTVVFDGQPVLSPQSAARAASDAIDALTGASPEVEPTK